jgi:hypothetical protein
MGFGDIFKSEKESTQTNQAAGFVDPYLRESTANYGNLTTPGAYGGDWQAGMNPMMSGSLDNMFNNTAGNQYQQSMGGFGGDAMSAMSAQMADPNNAFQFNQGVYDQTMGNLMPAMQGTYDAATRDNNRDLNWNQLPGIDMAAAGSGLQGSTKQGQQSALASAMTGDRNADIGASIYQNATNQAQNAGMNAGSQNMAAQQNLFNTGANSLNNAYSMNQGNLQNQYGAGQYQQGFDQQGADFNRQQWDTEQTNPWLYEGQRMQNLTNTGNTFGTQTNTQESSPGLGNVGLQLAGAWLGGGGGNPLAGFGGGDGAGYNPNDVNNNPMYNLNWGK